MKKQRASRQRRDQQKRKAYFFSDVHLGAGSESDERRKEERVVQFLTSIKRTAAEIYILGDLFDYWFEYKTVVPKGYYKLFSVLSELSEAGVRLCFVAGNHDYWAGEYFRKEFGMEVHHQPVEKIILGKRFYLHHGDGLLRDDVGYRILKRILRNPVNIFLYSLLHPDFSGRIARWSSHTSREYTSNRTYEEEGMIEFAASKIKEGFDYVVMGHNHRATSVPLGNGIYVNLGEWLEGNTYAVFDGEHIAIRRWRSQS